MFDSTFTKIDFEWIEFGKKWVEDKRIYVWIHFCKSELNNKFKCKIQF